MTVAIGDFRSEKDAHESLMLLLKHFRPKVTGTTTGVEKVAEAVWRIPIIIPSPEKEAKA